MRSSSGFASLSRSRRCWSRVLLLAGLLVVFGMAQGLAQAPAAEIPQAQAAMAGPAPATGEAAAFLATLSAVPAGDQAPAPEFLQTSTGCTSDAQCAPDKLCCRDCGFFGCTHKGCLTPMNGHCPAIP